MTFMRFTYFFLLLPIVCLTSDVISDNKVMEKQKLTMAPCQLCRALVNSFKKGLELTSRGKFDGGDAAWEQERLGNYAESEVRLVEIQEKLCLGLDYGEEQCHTLAGESEYIIEEWWFHKQQEEPDLFNYLCITSLKSCCPDKHFGPNCTPCTGYPDNICNNHGKCKGAGTRKGNGQCACNPGYTGEKCSQCAVDYFEFHKDDQKVECLPCHPSCQDSCSQAGSKGCFACKSGWVMDTDKGCIDLNECLQIDVCRKTQFCVNNEGSFACLDCDAACATCHGDGPDMCDSCAKDYTKKQNMCIAKQKFGKEGQASAIRYLTYLGLCVATCIIFQRSTVLASIIGVIVAVYISMSEYMLRSGGYNGSGLSSLFISP